LADKSKGESRTIVLDRNEWEAFVDEVERLAQVHSKLLARAKEYRNDLSRRQSARWPAYGKTSLASRILSFFGLRPSATAHGYGMFCPYCGTDAEPGDKFCRICGKNMHSQIGPDTARSMKPG